LGKKIVVKHKIVNGETICGRTVGEYSSIRGNKTWKGVTCKKCLAQRVVKKVKSVKVTASVGGE